MLCWCDTSFHQEVEKPRTSYRCPGPRTKPEQLQIRSNYGKDFSPRWASNLRNWPEMNFSQLYDYPVVSREYRHIVLRGTHYRKYHRSCSVWLRKRGKGCSPLGRGDLLLLLLLMWYLLLYHILQLKLFPFCLPRCILVCHLYIVSYGKLYKRACTPTSL